MRFDIDLREPFDQVSFLGEREEAERMIADGWTPVWEPGVKVGKISLPNYSDYFILVRDSQRDK